MMQAVLLLLILGLSIPGGSVLRRVAGQVEPGAPKPVSIADLVIVVSTSSERLPLVHATRAARRGIRMFVAVQNASEAARLNALYGGADGEHRETYIAWPDATGDEGEDAADDIPNRSAGGASGAASQLHPLHRLGPRWAIAPLLVHEALKAAGSTATSKSTTPTSPSSSFPTPGYRWMLVGRDDTLWLPHHAVNLLSQYDTISDTSSSTAGGAAAANTGIAAAISDHPVDFNGLSLLAPSAAAAVCLPCGLNLTALLGRRRPPGCPQPACPVCRPAAGCEYRFSLCGGLVGGRLCGSKRFLGSGDRCAHSWVAGGAGVALSYTLVDYLDKDDWVSCVRQSQPSTGERSLGRCLWRAGFAFTHPAAGLAGGLTREIFSDRHMLFGNPLARQDVFGIQTDALSSGADSAAAAAAVAAAASTTAAAAGHTWTSSVETDTSREAVEVSSEAGAAVVAAMASTRLRPAGSVECDSACRAWLARHVISAHLDVPYQPYEGQLQQQGVEVAAAVMERAAERIGEELAARGAGGGRRRR